MTAGSPVRLVVLFSIPLIFGNIFQQLYYITDAVIVGKYISIQALAAVNSCTWITWLLNAIARDFSNTLSILASYSVGEGDQEKVKKIVGNAGTITLLLSLFLLVFAETNLDLFFRLFKVQAEVIQMTGEYFSIVLFHESAKQLPAHRILAPGRGQAFQNQLIFHPCDLQPDFPVFFSFHKIFSPV